MISKENEELKLVEVAKMYYEENLTQDEIAKRYEVSRPIISKMLAKARKMGIVVIQIKDPYVNNSIFMGQLNNLFNLSGGIIVPEADNDLLTDTLIINQAFNYMKSILTETTNIGLGWGYSINSILEKILSGDMTPDYRGEVCPLIGNTIIPNRAYHPNEIIRIFAEKSGFNPHYLYAPAFPESQQEQELYFNTENYAEINNIWSNLDTMLISIENHPSVPDQATAMRFGNTLTERKAVGMFVSYYYDREGNIIKGDNDFVIHIPIEKLQRTKRVIAICSCNTNINAIIGALRTGYITHLITDERTAMDIIKNK